MNKDVERNLRGQIRKLRKQINRMKGELSALWTISSARGFFLSALIDKAFEGDEEGRIRLHQSAKCSFEHKSTKNMEDESDEQ